MLAFVCQWQCSCRAHDSVHRERRACSDGPLGVYVPFHHIARRIRISVAYGSYQGIFAPMFEGLLRKKGKYRSHLLGNPNRNFIPYPVVLLLVSSWVVCGVSRCSVGGLGHCVYVHPCSFSPISPRLLWLGQWSPPCPRARMPVVMVRQFLYECLMMMVGVMVWDCSCRFVWFQTPARVRRL